MELPLGLALEAFQFRRLQLELLPQCDRLRFEVVHLVGQLTSHGLEFGAQPLACHGGGRVQAALVGRFGGCRVGRLPDDVLERPHRRLPTESFWSAASCCRVAALWL